MEAEILGVGLTAAKLYLNVVLVVIIGLLAWIIYMKEKAMKDTLSTMEALPNKVLVQHDEQNAYLKFLVEEAKKSDREHHIILEKLVQSLDGIAKLLQEMDRNRILEEKNIRDDIKEVKKALKSKRK